MADTPSPIAEAEEMARRLARIEQNRASEPPLATSENEGDSKDMDATDAKIAAAEARAETSLAKAMGEMRAEFAALRGDIRELKASSASKGTVVLTGVTVFFGIAGLLLAVLAYGGDRFGAGAAQRDMVRAAVQEVMAQRKAAR
ncbi:MAG: hypothetical protein JNK30_18330 [Phenylobacterium sp.]|uniref:hypothetical protein n=1 Tax=Phenylobacterium sp. TaxID=1871053 RepID=UPI001A484E30|nr:hypothetical protein [Phenylobacterium sp.]MBL8773347.1 hypothetical protein [Phenylobacterium sp.]